MPRRHRALRALWLTAFLAGLLTLTVPADAEDRRRGTIAFHSQRTGAAEIFVVNPDGTGLSQLTSPYPIGARDTFPNWSPDGRLIAFQSDREGDFEVYFGDAQGRWVRRLTHTPGVDSRPVWSPDARRFLFHSDRGHPGVWDVYVMNRNGRRQRNLTADSPGNDRFADWSPDGQWIAFWSDRAGNDEIHVMDADGANPRNLTNHPGADVIPAWSPDGERIAFSSNRSGDEEIYVMNADGSSVSRLTNSPGMDRYPAWSPDGRSIAFVSARDGNFEIYVMDADGSDQTRITNDPALDFAPDWTSRRWAE